MKIFKSSDMQGGSGDGEYYYECDICHCLLRKDDHGINSKCLQCQLKQLQAENQRLRGTLIRLRDCDWVISLPDRMDAVRDIARKALEGRE